MVDGGSHSLIWITPCSILRKQYKNYLLSTKRRSLMYSSHNLTLRFDRSVMIARSSFPSGVTNFITPFGANRVRRSSLQHLPAGTGQTGVGDRSHRLLENPAIDQRTPIREGPRQGKCTLGCPKLDRQA
jgi:hypothetical protein